MKKKDLSAFIHYRLLLLIKERENIAKDISIVPQFKELRIKKVEGRIEELKHLKQYINDIKAKSKCYARRCKDEKETN
jgi:hypothetical protein